MINDTNFLPATILKPRPTRAQFERDFVNAKIDDDLYETARKNTSASQKRIILSSLPFDWKGSSWRIAQPTGIKILLFRSITPNEYFKPCGLEKFYQLMEKG